MTSQGGSPIINASINQEIKIVAVETACAQVWKAAKLKQLLIVFLIKISTLLC